MGWVCCAARSTSPFLSPRLIIPCHACLIASDSPAFISYLNRLGDVLSCRGAHQQMMILCGISADELANSAYSSASNLWMSSDDGTTFTNVQSVNELIADAMFSSVAFSDTDPDSPGEYMVRVICVRAFRSWCAQMLAVRELVYILQRASSLFRCMCWLSRSRGSCGTDQHSCACVFLCKGIRAALDRGWCRGEGAHHDVDVQRHRGELDHDQHCRSRDDWHNVPPVGAAPNKT